MKPVAYLLAATAEMERSVVWYEKRERGLGVRFHAALKEAGITDEQLARLHAPIGLEIGARQPEEIAVSIIGEIVAVSNGLEHVKS